MAKENVDLEFRLKNRWNKKLSFWWPKSIKSPVGL